MTNTELEELEELLAKAVGLPWRHGETWRPAIHGEKHTGDRRDSEGNVFWGYSISGSNENGGAILPTLGAVHNFPDRCEANADLIVSAVNSLPSLIARIRKLEAVAEAAQNWRRNPAGTDEGLNKRLRAALAALEEVKP